MSKTRKQKSDKFSIILTVYNGQESIRECIESIFNLNYPKDKYELIIVDDGSTDKTSTILRRLEVKASEIKANYKIIENSKNLGRIQARARGVQEAKNERILIMDTQLVVHPDVLIQASGFSNEINLISNVYMDKTLSIDDRVLYLIRKRLYSPYWGKFFPEVEITLENFNKVSKGTGGFFTTKKLFLEHSAKLKGMKNENDDTKLLYEYIDNKQKLIRTPKIKLLYRNRTGLSSLKHLFNRGPKFVDYYLRSIPQFALFLFGNLLALSILILLALINFFLLYNLMLVIFVTFLIICISLSESLIDLIALLLYLPFITIVFLGGIYKGIAIKLLRLRLIG